MTDLMLDLETLSLSNRARILSIGICEFDRLTNRIGKTFYVSLEPPIQDSVLLTTDVSSDTIKWWRAQAKEAQVALKVNLVPYAKALDMALTFLQQFDSASIKMWSKDPQFDGAIFAYNLSLIGKVVPWNFYNERSVRTIMDLAEDGLKDAINLPPFIKHHALEDAISQAHYVSYCFNYLLGVRDVNNSFSS